MFMLPESLPQKLEEWREFGILCGIRMPPQRTGAFAEFLSGLNERVAFFNEENGFAVRHFRNITTFECSVMASWFVSLG